jgi:hypothetical protein
MARVRTVDPQRTQDGTSRWSATAGTAQALPQMLHRKRAFLPFAEAPGKRARDDSLRKPREIRVVRLGAPERRRVTASFIGLRQGGDPSAIAEALEQWL